MTRPLILAALLAACTPMPDRMDCTDGAAWRSACDKADQEAEPEIGGGVATPDAGDEKTPEEPDTEPDQPETDGQNPGNGKEVGKAPHDGERGEQPSGKEKK